MEMKMLQFEFAFIQNESKFNKIMNEIRLALNEAIELIEDVPGDEEGGEGEDGRVTNSPMV